MLSTKPLPSKKVLAPPTCAPLALLALLAGASDVMAQDWSLTGNAGTSPATNFLGTTDAIPLEFRVNNERALRIEAPAPDFNGVVFPNLIGGFGGNFVTPGVRGATIGGGGLDGPNRVTDAFGTVGGGGNNEAGGVATVGGGLGNRASGGVSAIGGGRSNVATEALSTVSGGELNQASHLHATVGGGRGNLAGGRESSVGGGSSNAATDLQGTVAGGNANTAAGPQSTIGGGFNNIASLSFATVAGGGRNGASFGAAIGGGIENIASGAFATIAGGAHNRASAFLTTIGGGGTNSANQLGNRATDNHGTVGGGNDNQAGNGTEDIRDAPFATVAGGESNTASGSHATIGGGRGNTAGADNATVGGGSGNTAGGSLSSVSGGIRNTAGGSSSFVGGGNGSTAGGPFSFVGGGANNTARGDNSAVAGGFSNAALGPFSAIPGGSQNVAEGGNSFAAGFRARALDEGTFVWSDAVTGFVFQSTAPNQFNVRASGGTRIFSNPAATVGVRLLPNDIGWDSVSDRALKENLTPVDSQEILVRLSQLPITRWNLTSQGPAIQHLGPTAQDFHAAFGLGADERHIGTVDADGVALAAIQGLHRVVQEQQEQIARLEARLAMLERAQGDAAHRTR